MTKIQDKDRLYSALRSYVDFMFKMAYRRVEYYGKENVPKDAAIIYAPNHTNTLMDALAVLAIDRQAKVFVARADIFKKPTARKILTFLKMLPINRKRDGNENLAKNEEINNIVVDVLHDKIPFCILPEGTHRTKHSLMTLQKGIFRIALQANENFGKELPIYIVPVGLEFGHWFRYRSSLLVQIGNPINVTEFVENNSNLTEPEQINELRELLSSHLKEVILHIADDSNYEATFELCHICNNKQLQTLGLKNNRLENRFLSAKKTIKDVEELLSTNASALPDILQKANRFSEERHDAKIGVESLISKHISFSIIKNILLLLLGFPYFILSLILSAPITLTSKWACSLFKDPAFHNTVRFLVSLVLIPILLLIIVLVVGFVFSWIWALIAAILFLPSFFFFYDYLRIVRLLRSGIKWKLRKKLRKQFSEIQKCFWKLEEEK